MQRNQIGSAKAFELISSVLDEPSNYIPVTFTTVTLSNELSSWLLFSANALKLLNEIARRRQIRAISGNAAEREI